MLAWELVDTARDHNRNDTAKHARAWLAPKLQRQVASYTPAAGQGADWPSLTRHRAWLQITVTLVGDDHPPDTADTALRQVTVEVTPMGRDGWRGARSVHVDAVRLVASPDGWRLDSILPT